MASWLNWLLRAVRLAPTVANVAKTVAPSKTTETISSVSDTLVSELDKVNPDSEAQRAGTVAGAAANHASHIAGK